MASTAPRAASTSQRLRRQLHRPPPPPPQLPQLPPPPPLRLRRLPPLRAPPPQPLQQPLARALPRQMPGPMSVAPRTTSTRDRSRSVSRFPMATVWKLAPPRATRRVTTTLERSTRTSAVRAFRSGFTAPTDRPASILTDCDSQLRNGATPIPESSCDMVCSGNSSEICGGPNALSLYYYNGTVPPPANGGGGGGGGGGGTTGTGHPVTSGLPTPWHYVGCYM
jgi:hypothetical protein